MSSRFFTNGSRNPLAIRTPTSSRHRPQLLAGHKRILHWKNRIGGTAWRRFNGEAPNEGPDSAVANNDARCAVRATAGTTGKTTLSASRRHGAVHTSADRRRRPRLMERHPSAFVTGTFPNYYVSTPFMKANSKLAAKTEPSRQSVLTGVTHCHILPPPPMLAGPATLPTILSLRIADCFNTHRVRIHSRPSHIVT
jgi:hypothetical protein